MPNLAGTLLWSGAPNQTPDPKTRMNPQPLVRIGTRGSPLALAQTRETRDRLAAAVPELADPDAIEIAIIQTTGDRVLDRPLADVGGKGLFTKEIDQAMLDGRIDLAVHSMKDVPTWLPDGIVLPCILPREAPWDVLICADAGRLADLRPGGVVGTASLRRQAQILSRRPDLRVVSFRGNVQTRLSKLERGEAAATILAIAGLRRLGMAETGTALDVDEMLPAAGQGAIGVTCREDDSRARDWLSRIDHPESRLRVAAERAFLEVLDGSCRTPIAALAEIDDSNRLSLRGLIARPDGSGRIETACLGSVGDAVRIGRDAGKDIRARAEPDILAATP